MINTFIEIGAGIGGVFCYLLNTDWKERASILETQHKGSAFISEEIRLLEGEWEGWFVEPVPHFLSATIEQNQDLENVHFIQGAIDAESKFQEIDIYKLTNESSDIHEMSSLVFHKRADHKVNHDFLNKILLQTFTLDALLDYLDITPTILRIDVEGVERRVLESYSWKRYPQIWQIDHHNENQDYFVNTFEENGYRILGTSCGLNDDEIHVEKRVKW